jgi:hypothetical protein
VVGANGLAFHARNATTKGGGKDFWLVPISKITTQFYAMYLNATGQNTSFLRHFILKTMILPRQARGKHRENSKRMAFSYRLAGGSTTHTRTNPTGAGSASRSAYAAGAAGAARATMRREPAKQRYGQAEQLLPLASDGRDGAALHV